MSLPLTQIVQWLLTYKYFVLFPLAVIEGPIVTIVAGFLASTGQLDSFAAYGVVLIGDIVGDSVYYFLGRWGGFSLINRFGHYVRLTTERVQKIKQHYANHAAKTIILGKFAHSVEIPFLVAAGLSKVSYRKFVLCVFVSSIPKSLIFILIGYYFGQAYSQISKYLNYTALIMVAIAVFLIFIYLIIGKISKKYTN